MIYETLMCFGGPLHGKNLKVTPGQHRIEVVERRHLEPGFLCNDFVKTYPNLNPVTYYRETFGIGSSTVAGAAVYKTLDILLLEGAELLEHEYFDLETEMAARCKWHWREEPHFIEEFDQWFEKCLHDNGIRKVSTW